MVHQRQQEGRSVEEVVVAGKDDNNNSSNIIIIANRNNNDNFTNRNNNIMHRQSSQQQQQATTTTFFLVSISSGSGIHEMTFAVLCNFLYLRLDADLSNSTLAAGVLLLFLKCYKPTRMYFTALSMALKGFALGKGANRYPCSCCCSAITSWA